jgi:hypothetical protein
MERIPVIKSPFTLLVLLLILGPVAELWPYWVSFVVGLLIIALVLVIRKADLF